ncbi:MAG: hypothetical protein SGPRY_001861 [Prymnesium sp.]
MLAEGERGAETKETSESAPLVAINFGIVAAVRQRLYVRALHEKALALFEPLASVKLEPKHASQMFENISRKEGTAQQ